MMKKLALAAALACTFSAPMVHAEDKPAAAASISPAKQELIKKLLVLHQPAFEAISREIAEQQPMQVRAAAFRMIQQNVPQDKQAATAQAVDEQLKKYLDAAAPKIQASANKLAQETLTPRLNDKFSEEELRNLVQVLESPVLKKFKELLPDMTADLREKIVADARPAVDPALNQMALSVRQVLAAAAPNASAPAKSGSSAKSSTKK